MSTFSKVLVGAVCVGLLSGCTIATRDSDGDARAADATSTTSAAVPELAPTSAPEVWVTPTPIETLPPEELASQFSALESTVGGSIGIAMVPVGGGPATVLGSWQSGVAWSTVKVPLAVAAVRSSADAAADSAAEDDASAAITYSDNDSADALWNTLGDHEAAATAVEAVLRQGGDAVTTVVREQTRPGFSSFGQTEWSTQEQARFAAGLSCIPDAAPIVELMNNVVPAQRWGLGQMSDAAFKGGWGPDVAGAYEVRQFGIVTTVAGRLGVSVAAQADSGTFEDGIAILDSIGSWLESRSAQLPAGQCL